MSVSCALVEKGSPAETAVRGHVWSGPEPVTRAYVRISKPDGEYASEVRVGPGGAFYIPMLPGSWEVLCFAPNAVRLVQPLQVSRGDQFEVDFRLDGDGVAGLGASG